MKKMIYLGLLLTGYQSFSVMAQCGPVNNIIQDVPSNSTIGEGSLPLSIGQSFIATCSGNIEAITVRNSPNNIATGDIMLTLYDGVNPYNPMDSVVVAITPQNAYNELLITLPTPVFLTSGNEYTFMLRNVTGYSGYFALETDPYLGGKLKIQVVGSPVFENYTDSLDMYFKVHYQGVPDAIDSVEIQLNSRLEVFPNPSNGLFQIKLNTNDSAQIKIELYDVTGKAVSSNFHINKGAKNTFDIDASGSETGMYFLKVSSGSEQWVKQIVVNKQ